MVCTTKLPLFNAKGTPIGVCGVTRDVKEMRSKHARLPFWAPVLEVMMNDYAKPLSTESLATTMSLSASQFTRLFRKKFNTTPHAYLNNVRLNAACHLLVTTDLPISEVALQTGFYDQSHFSNLLARHRGLPPAQFRKKYVQEREPALHSPSSAPLRGVAKPRG